MNLWLTPFAKAAFCKKIFYTTKVDFQEPSSTLKKGVNYVMVQLVNYWTAKFQPMQKMENVIFRKANICFNHVKNSKNWRCKIFQYWPLKHCPANIYLFKVNNRDTRTKCEIFSKLTVKTPERRHWHRSGVFISQLFLVSFFVVFFLINIFYPDHSAYIYTKLLTFS